MNNSTWRGDRSSIRRTSNHVRERGRTHQYPNVANASSRQQNILVDNTTPYQPFDWNYVDDLQNIRHDSDVRANNDSSWPGRTGVELSGAGIDSMTLDSPSVADSTWPLTSSPMFSQPSSSINPFSNDQTMLNGTNLDHFSTVNANTRASESRNGRLTVQLENGTFVPAIFHRDRYPNHQKLNQTTYRETAEALRKWDVDESGDKPIIVYHTDEQQNAQPRAQASSSYTPWRDSAGRVLVNSNNKPLKASTHLPDTVSTKIEGWRMEVIMRLDPNVTWDDFLDRMPDPSFLVSRTCASSLQSRRRKDIRIFEFRTRPQTRDSQSTTSLYRHNPRYMN